VLSRRSIWGFLLVITAAKAADNQKLPWYMQETAMTGDGRLTFFDKPWWPRAKALKEGESFTMDLNHDGRPDTIVTRKEDNLIEAIDDSGHAADIWNQASTAYVVSSASPPWEPFRTAIRT
jgi:hypothetical protein